MIEIETRETLKEGALTENYVLQTLATQFEGLPHYWPQSNPPYLAEKLFKPGSQRNHGEILLNLLS